MANKVFIDNLLDPDTGDQGFFLGMNTDQCYPGMDLSLKFAEEIKGYTSVWKWIQARIKAGNFYGIHVGDYIPFNCTDSAKTRIVAVVAGIDTYYKYGDQQVGHHIDFISKDLWPTYIQYNLANFNNGLIPVEKLSGDGSKTEFALTKQMDSIEVIESFFESAPANATPLWYLGESLKLLGTADFAVFAPGWQDYRGCRIEHDAAVAYGIPIAEV